jgi:hypothetical protein
MRRRHPTVALGFPAAPVGVQLLVQHVDERPGDLILLLG